jgi:hypothetical protein
MNRQDIIDTAMKVSRERGYDMYIIYDEFNDEYTFTQERNIFLYNGQKMIYVTDGINLITL